MFKWRGYVFNGSIDRIFVFGSLLIIRDYLRFFSKVIVMVERIWK